MVEKRERKNIDWQRAVLPVARDIVESYDTAVTLRQLFYRLVSLPHGHPGRIPNTLNAYSVLSSVTAEGRRDGTFPDLIDQRAEIVVENSWVSPKEAIETMRGWYRRDRTDGQRYQLWLAVEKEGMVAQLDSWFGDLGIPIISLGGQATQGMIDKVRPRVEADGRDAILVYGGDHDPSGWRILQSFVDRTGWWVNPELPQWDPAKMPQNRGWTVTARGKPKNVIPNYDCYRKYRVALGPEQCAEHDLPRNPAKGKDPNLPAFLKTFADTLTPNEVAAGLGVQVEMDALEPTVLRQLYADAIDQHWDADANEVVLADEEDDIAKLDGIWPTSTERPTAPNSASTALTRASAATTARSSGSYPSAAMAARSMSSMVG